MQNKRYLLTFLVMLPILFGAVLTPTNYTLNSDSKMESSDFLEVDDTKIRNLDTFVLSQDTQNGILNPNTMTLRGYQETDLLRARTDSGRNSQQNITIDETNDWSVSASEIQVSNLKKLYAVNGTFDDEVDPWTSSLYDASGGSQVQSAVWNSTEGYVSLINYGELKTHPVQDDTYTHYLNSELIWQQTVSNIPQANNFSLSFSYRYVSGPIDLSPYDFNGDVELRIYIHTDVYYISIATSGSRNVWYSITDYPIELIGAPSTFNVGIGIYIEYENLVLTENGDYDDDGLPDGLVNAQKIELNFDNIEFKSQTPVPYADVNLTYNVEGLTNPITGPTGGIGISTITNPSFWSVDPLEIEVTANSTVSFDYFVTTYFQRQINSSWTTGLSEYGVSYSIDAGQNADLELYTYVMASSDYENLTLEIEFPLDWENTTILDPLQNDITGLCSITAGSIFVPNSLFVRVGWWKITHQSFNYAKSIDVQIYDTEMWISGSLFRPGNLTRTQVELGTASVTPSTGSPVNIDWIMPNGSIWSSDSVSSIIGGFANSSSLTLGGINTSAGLWEVLVLWNNGTEVAYGIATFELYHQAAAVVRYPTIETEHGLVLANQITLTDIDTGEYLLDDDVSITANWSTTTVIFSQNFAKNWWTAEFDTALVENGVFTVIVDISRPYFDSITTQFTIISIFETSMNIINAGSLPIENGLNEIFTVQMEYDLLNGTGVGGALPSVSFSGVPNGLRWQNFIDNNNGLYSLDIVCNISETYEVTITLSKPYHYNISDSFTLIIGETGSELELLNGTADLILFGNDYRLVLEYRNSTGYGLPGANLEILSMTPSTGLTNGSFIHLYDGYYEITFTPTSSGTYSIVITASILNHETQYTTFTLTISGVPTILTALPSTKTVAVNQSFTVQLRFWEDQDDHTPIDSAIISIINPPSGISISSVTPVGGGLYNITLASSQITTFDLLFRAIAINYLSSSASFTFVVTEIQTELIFEGDVTSTRIEFSDPFELIIYYDRLDTGAPIQGADISVIPGDIAELDISILEYTGYYVITIKGNGVGSWALTIVANKSDHRVATKSFFIEVEEIDTTVEGSSPLETLLIGRTYDFTFNFIFEANSSYIRDATVISSGGGANWATYIELGSGQYAVNLTPQELGQHSVTLTFEKVGFASASFRLTFNVGRIPITIEVLQGLSGLESSPSLVSVRITESDTGNPVPGILVFCRIIDPYGAPSSTISLNETDTVGVYSGTISMPVAEGEYQLQITCEASNYVLNTGFAVDLHPSRDLTTMLWITTIRYYPIMLVFAALGAGLVYRRSARKKRIRENKATLAIKRRFDDIRNLLGVIVLHKESGLPIYSKILRDGLEETVISAFITAITSFRGEFDIETSTEEWGLIPISDIVRVISTNKLVCAFITTGNPSPEQRERMIQFAKTVGFIFDDRMEDVPIVVLDHHTTQQFNSLFEDLLDGQLLRTYKLDEVKKFPTTSCANERIARKHGVEFKLEELASEIASCGLEEGRVYKAILDALENHYLVTTEDSPFATELLRASDVAHEES